VSVRRAFPPGEYERILVGAILSFWGTLLVVVPLQLLLVVLYVLSLLPIEEVKKQVLRVTTRLSEIIGDSYVFVASPVMRSAITSKLLADLGWLETKCDKVIVLAHSQGAAVAFDALRDRPDDKPVYLITYGAGIRKLFEMEQMTRSGRWLPFSCASSGWYFSWPSSLAK
jgi:hypothetical protein